MAVVKAVEIEGWNDGGSSVNVGTGNSGGSDGMVRA